MEAINLSLPEFAFLDGNFPNGNTLENRTVILHVRSATVLEFFHDVVLLKENIINKEFEYKNMHNIIETITCAVHFSPLVDDKEIITNDIINPAIKWYKEYLTWEDKGINQNINSINN